VDNSVTPDARALRWSPPAALVALGWCGTVAALFWCLLGAREPTGRLLAGVSVLVLASAALFGSRARPRLTADGAGLSVRGLGAPTRFEWSAVSRVRLVHTRRFGRDVPSLEIDARAPGATDDRLLVFGWLDLGADPREVAEALETLRGPGNGQPVADDG
jgi:Bacterial PH domain